MQFMSWAKDQKSIRIQKCMKCCFSLQYLEDIVWTGVCQMAPVFQTCTWLDIFQKFLVLHKDIIWPGVSLGSDFDKIKRNRCLQFSSGQILRCHIINHLTGILVLIKDLVQMGWAHKNVRSKYCCVYIFISTHGIHVIAFYIIAYYLD